MNLEQILDSLAQNDGAGPASPVVQAGIANLLRHVRLMRLAIDLELIVAATPGVNQDQRCYHILVAR
jgi:hypothetical protein